MPYVVLSGDSNSVYSATIEGVPVGLCFGCGLKICSNCDQIGSNKGIVIFEGDVAPEEAYEIISQGSCKPERL